MSGTPQRPRLVRNPSPAVAIAGQPAPAALEPQSPPAQAEPETPVPEANPPAESEAQAPPATAQPRAAQNLAPKAPPSKVVPLGGRLADTPPGNRQEETASVARPEDLTKAWERVAAAGFSARRESRSWTPYTPRLPETMWAALDDRTLVDARRTGDYGVAVCHYLQVAFDGLPREGNAIDAAAAAAAGLDWLRRAGNPGPLVPTGSRLQKAMKAQMQDLAKLLRRQQPRVELWVVQAAFVQALLDDLERDDRPDGQNG